MIPLWLGLAFAGPTVTDDLVYTVVDELYGKPIPHEGVCIERPVLPEALGVDVVAIGVKRGQRGCTLIGAMVDGSFAKPEAASKKAFDDTRWSTGDAATHTAWLQAWTASVLHAFHQFDLDDPHPVAKGAGRGWTVQTTTWRRTDDRFVAAQVRESFSYGPDRALIQRVPESLTHSRLAFTANEIKLGGLPPEPIHTAIQQQGRRIAGCVETAWAADLKVSGRTRVQWTIVDGKATQLAIVASDDDGSGLAECYARAVARVEFPKNLGGTVVWAFNLAQKPVE